MERTDFKASSLEVEKPQLAWNVKKSKLYLNSRVSYDPRTWNVSGRVTSVVDLRGAQLEFHAWTEPIDQPNAEADRQQKERLSFELGLEIKTVALEVSTGRTIWLQRDKLHKVNKWGHVLFVVTLPTNEAEFEEFTKSRDD